MFESMYSERLNVKALVYLLCICLMLTACSKTQPKTYTIGVVNTAPSLNTVLDGFKAGMAELGYVEGEDIIYLYDGPVGPDVDKIVPLVRHLLESDVDLILSLGTLVSQAVKQATAGTDVPVVFTSTDPVAAGIVENLRHPGGNMTGIRSEPADDRRLGLLLQVAPHVERIYIPYNPNDMSTMSALAAIREGASKLGVELVLRQARDDDQVRAAIETIPDDVDAIFLLPDALVIAYEEGLVDMALKGVQAARLADQIRKGVNPGDLPIESHLPVFAINLTTAQVVGLDIPHEILQEADIIIR